ncbi:hypothetical protein [Caballeronia sp. LZ032]|uniref:hypothetical protein n=1 Tax=Caballeronia sp. LZ032 TaxID=3038565 RepID=UPI00285F582D|nr:hypothetical protein [Caballeronia sp. LZ032]MDR5879014.1 hypothetical protein [Caballeronia sp. LZ032]
MPAGLLVWDEAGRLVVDTTTFLGRYLGQAVIGNGTGSIVNDQFTQGIPWAIPVMDNASPIDPNASSTFGFVDIYSWMTTPSWYFSDNQLVWTRDLSKTPTNWQSPTCTLIYGVN